MTEIDKRMLQEISGADPQSIEVNYIDYNREVGGEPFGFTTGMPVEADPDKYGGISEMYPGMYRRGSGREELLQGMDIVMN